MASKQKNISYRRQGETGTLTISGVVDIFEAAALHSEAKRALADDKAVSIRIAADGAERIDMSAMQILLALRNGVEAGGRKFVVENLPASAVRRFEQTGISF